MSTHGTVLSVHIIAGGLALLAGFIALFVVKGGRLHKRSGMVFVFAMIGMALIGGTMAVVWNRAAEANAPIGLLTAYLVVTSLTTVRPLTTGARRVDLALMLLVTSVSATLFAFGVIAYASPRHSLSGMPAVPFFIFGALALIASVGDLQMIRAGGVQALRGAPRISRHLWRMTLALAIAAFSFFLGQAKVIPQPYRIFPLLAIPPVVVVVSLFYWMWRVRWRKYLVTPSERSESRGLHKKPSLKVQIPRLRSG